MPSPVVSLKVNSLPSELKDIAKELIAVKFDLPREGEVMEKKVPAPVSPMPMQPVAWRNGNGYTIIKCGGCGYGYEQVQSQSNQQYINPFQQSQATMYNPNSINAGTTNPNAFYQGSYYRSMSFMCPACGRHNQGTVKIY